MKRNTRRKSHVGARYMTLGILFCVICFAFVIVLGFVQLSGNVLPLDDDTVERTYTVPGLRGEIYDRNGVLLVGNSTSYDLVYEYGAMPDTRREINLSLLEIMDTLMRTGNGDKIADDLFILTGTYPNMKFDASLRDRDSDEYAQYTKFLARQKMEAGSTEAQDVMNYFVKRYKLYDTQYTAEEITTLIRLYYEMERVDFGQYQSYTIARNVNMSVISSLEESNIEGVNFEIREEREYAYPGIASHILGRLGKITAENKDYYLERNYPLDALVGTSGCEQAFEEWLRGSDGVAVIRYDKNGNQIEKFYKTEPIRGNDVYLTIDIELQIAAEQGLAENVQRVDSADAGAVTVMDPNSGAVYAIASYPTYDLTQFESVSYYQSLLANINLPLYNRALNGVYAPGSTYKIGAAMAALETDAIDLESTYVCEHTYPHYNGEYTCLGNHGTLNVIGAIRDSCNVFFYYLADQMGIDPMTNYTKRLGLGVDTGLELSNKSGMIAGPTYRKEAGLGAWFPGDNLSAAIGQSDHGYTPLQISVYLSSVVNGGTRYRAHLLDSVRKFYTAEPVSQTQPQVLDQVEFSEQTYEILIEAMGKVVSESTSLTAQFGSLPVTVGGKTGTAQVTGKKDYAVFSGFAPLENPEIVVSCVIEEGVAGSNAAYTVRCIMEKYFSIKSGNGALE